MSYKNILNRLKGAAAGRALPGQVANNAGGYFYAVDHWMRLDRFLMLGSDNGTFYVGPVALTRQNAAAVETCLAEDGARVVNRIVEISEAGRAPKNDPALIALALAASVDDLDVRQKALAALPRVARTGTHMLHFADYVDGFRGWGRSLRRAVGDWFIDKPVDRLALQAVKYRQRDGWALRDLLRLAHPAPKDGAKKAVLDWIAHADSAEAIAGAREAAPLLEGYMRVREAEGVEAAAEAIVRYSLPREAVPTELLNEQAIWDALLVDMPMTAMVRNLGKMSAVGLITSGSDAASYVADKLLDATALKRARAHPIALLLALRTYARGQGVLGRLKWAPVRDVVDALDEAFDLSFQNVQATGKRILVAVDVSGSMRCPVAGTPVLSAAEAAAAMAVMFVRSEKAAEVVSFDTRVRAEAITPRQRLDDVTRKLGERWGGTDVAQPILYAQKKGLEVDAFVLLTDSETWAGRVHAQKALDKYRETINPMAKIACLSTAANHGQVIDPADPLSFGAAGFDASVPALVSDFISG